MLTDVARERQGYSEHGRQVHLAHHGADLSTREKRREVSVSQSAKVKIKGDGKEIRDTISNSVFSADLFVKTTSYTPRFGRNPAPLEARRELRTRLRGGGGPGAKQGVFDSFPGGRHERGNLKKVCMVGTVPVAAPNGSS